MWAFDGGVDGLGSRCAWSGDNGGIDESDSRGSELGLSGDDLDGVAEDGAGRHVSMV